jgi:hypothetical protein
MKLMTIILASLLCATTAMGAEDCTLKQVASLDMTTLPGGTIGVPLKIAGENRIFVLRMEFPYSAVSQSFADSLHLAHAPLAPSGNKVNLLGRDVTDVTTLPDLQIGAVSGKDVPVLLLPNATDAAAVGILAFDLLSNFDVELDFHDAKLNLFSPDHCPGKVVYWADSYASVPFIRDALGGILFKIDLDGHRLKARLSTSEPNAALHGWVAENRMDIFTKDLVALSPASKDATRYRYPFKRLSLGDVAINNPAVDVLTLETDQTCDGMATPDVGSRTTICHGGSDIAIGLKELRALRLYFSFKENELYVTAADAHH